MRAQLQSRGAKTIRGLGRVFRHFDSVDGNRKCDSNEFFTGLQDIGVSCTKDECDVSDLLRKIYVWTTNILYFVATHETFGH